MKKIFGFALFMVIGYNSYSQKGFHVGGFLGMNSVWIVNQNAWNITSQSVPNLATPSDEQPELEYRAAFGGMYGIAMGYNFTDNIGFQTEFLFSHQGQKYEGYYYGTNFIEKEVRLHYFQIPILFKFTSNSPNARFFVMAGPQFGFLTQAHSTINWDGMPHAFVDPYTGESLEYDNLDVMHRYQPSDIGFHLNVGTDIPLTDNLYLSAGLKLYWGFPDINDEDWRLVKLSAPYDYVKSTAAYGGLNVGFHYVIGEGYTNRRY